jgi:hypothetical protein
VDSKSVRKTASPALWNAGEEYGDQSAISQVILVRGYLWILAART